jgi:hypothetical protein
LGFGISIGIWDLGFGIFTRVSAHNPISTRVTWTREISALLERRCVSCHRPGGYASFSLATYDEARPWAVAIKEEVLAGTMPPWGAAPGIGHFANDRRLTRHEQELIAAWVDGGAPYSIPPVPIAARPVPTPVQFNPPPGGVSIPLARASIGEATTRTASVALKAGDGMVLTGWTFEPGVAALVERVDLEFGTRWLGAWVPGEPAIEFPTDAGVPITPASRFTARISYRTPPDPVLDRSSVRIWMAHENRPKTLREVTVMKNWRATSALEVVAVRPTRDEDEAQIVARFADGRAEPLGILDRPSRGPHPMYRLARPLSLPGGSLVETSAPVRLLYSVGATRTVKSNVSNRPSR